MAARGSKTTPHLSGRHSEERKHPATTGVIMWPCDSGCNWENNGLETKWLSTDDGDDDADAYDDDADDNDDDDGNFNDDDDGD